MEEQTIPIILYYEVIDPLYYSEINNKSNILDNYSIKNNTEFNSNKTLIPRNEIEPLFINMINNIIHDPIIRETYNSRVKPVPKLYSDPEKREKAEKEETISDVLCDKEFQKNLGDILDSTIHNIIQESVSGRFNFSENPKTYMKIQK